MLICVVVSVMDANLYLQGLVYIDKNVLGWRPLAKAWLDQRNADERRVLEKAFDKTLDAVCNFVFHDRR